jgi:hypothetical protein
MAEWDDDIAKLNLTDIEKNGLQIYRNYQRSFEDHAQKQFIAEIDAEPFDTTDLKHVLQLIASEDPVFVPVIACSFFDEILKKMFKKEIGDKIPGGRSKLAGPYGPISDLFKRIQLASAFDMVSSDIMFEVDKLRCIRNAVSHTWDIKSLKEFFKEEPATSIFPIHDLLKSRPNWFGSSPKPISDLEKFRVSVIWILARLAYETSLYARVKRRRLDPYKTLYGSGHPKRLIAIAMVAMTVSREAIAQNTE